MKTSDFYKKINDLLESRETYIVRNCYSDIDIKIKKTIEDLELSINKKRPNYYFKFLPKILEFDEEVVTVVTSKNRRFINQNKKAKELEIELKENEYLGYFTTDNKAIFYTKDNRSLGQFSIPSKGILIKQNTQIKMIESTSIRQKRSNQKYGNLEISEKILIDNIQRIIYKKVSNIT